MRNSALKTSQGYELFLTDETIYQGQMACLTGNDSMKDARKALVVLAIEKTLLEVGRPAYDEVLGKLNEDYNCYLSDCYENPEYLSKVLKELYGQSHFAIIESIKKYLAESSTQEDITKFIIKISE